MKGIYALAGHLTETDLYVINRAERELDYVTVAIPLSAGACGSDMSKSLTMLRREFRESISISIDFYREGELESFLKSVSTAQEAVYAKEGIGLFLRRVVASPKTLLSGRKNHLSHFEEIDLRHDVALVVPNNNSDVYSEIDFPKYFIN